FVYGPFILELIACFYRVISNRKRIFTVHIKRGARCFIAKNMVCRLHFYFKLLRSILFALYVKFIRQSIGWSRSFFLLRHYGEFCCALVNLFCFIFSHWSITLGFCFKFGVIDALGKRLLFYKLRKLNVFTIVRAKNRGKVTAYSSTPSTDFINFYGLIFFL